METYKRVCDILDRIKSVYRQLHHVYDELSEDSDDEKLKLLLDYMSRHEEYINAALAQYEPQAAESILNTWIQYIPDETLQRAFRDVHFSPDMPRDEVIDSALQFDQALLELYEYLAESRTVPKVQELFASLVEMEQKKSYQYALALLDEA